MRIEGDWEAWLNFFLTGVRETAESAAKAARELLNIAKADERRVQAAAGKGVGSVLRVHRLLQRQPLTSIGKASKILNLSVPTVTKSMVCLEGLKIVREVTGQKRKRFFAYEAYLNVLNRETEPPS